MSERDLKLVVDEVCEDGSVSSLKLTSEPYRKGGPIVDLNKPRDYSPSEFQDVILEVLDYVEKNEIKNMSLKRKNEQIAFLKNAAKNVPGLNPPLSD